MRQSKFVELVSAYLDGEITEKEMSRLRKELASNSERRELFASYKRMNEAATQARFPAMEIEPAAGYRHSLAVSTVSWCVAGSFAGFLAVFVFMAASRDSAKLEDAFVMMDVAKKVVVTNDVAKPAAPKLQQEKSEIALAQRTPIHELVAASSFARESKDQLHYAAYSSPVVEDPLEHNFGNPASEYTFAKATPFAQPNSSLFTPVSFVPVTDH